MNETGITPWDQRLARRLVAPLKDTRVHPNHLTTLSLLLALGAAILFAAAPARFADLAAVLYMLAVFCDHTDGELARLSGKTSTFGHYYDYVVGGLNYTLLFIGIGIGLDALYPGHWPLWLGLAAGLANPVILALRMHMEARHGFQAVDHPARYGFTIEDFIYLIGPITWFAGIEYFFVPYALGTFGYLAWTIGEYRRWNRRSITD
jgi:phosphatidylglycerophosphate synthase